jgi:hypothetical protein
MKDRVKGLRIKAILAAMALPTSLAHASTATDMNPVNRSLENSMDWATVPGNTGTPYDNFLLGALSPVH